VVAISSRLDEISSSGVTHVVEVQGEELKRYTVAPGDVDIDLADPHSPTLQGGTPAQNAAVTRAILAGESGPATDLAVINAAGAIYAAGAVESLADGVQAARAALADGSAGRALEGYVQASRRNAPVGADA
jgi:anthranilate phosphoribosyltransferase